MIVNLDRFVAAERGFWDEFDRMLTRLEEDASARLTLDEINRFYYLYQRCSAALAKLSGAPGETEMRQYVEALVARGYSEIHSVRDGRSRLHVRAWLFGAFPQAFRRHSRAFALAVAVTLVGIAFGAGAVAFDPGAKRVIMPFPGLAGDPAKRVADEERSAGARITGHQSSFSAMLMTHNTQVALLAMALGMSWGAGTLILLFYNGVILGAVALDYLRAGQGLFLFGWLMPHGVVEIPAILIAGQAGFVLAGALIGRGERTPRAMRLRAAGPDLVALIGGVAAMLVWAGAVEAFLSQYHQPVIPYWLKILFGAVELAALTLFLTRAGGAANASRRPAD